MEDDTPRKLGRYELIRRIAVGGMGEIYLARVSGTAGFEKTVIIKTILPHLAEEETFVDKFLDEGRIVVNLTHGNIVPVFDMDEVDGEYFIAMDYVPGRDVREVLKRLRERGEVMPPEIAAYIVAEVCEGLGYAHRQTDEQGNDLGIVHRDVSPSNVLISTEGEVKIIDFGIARAADRRAKTVSGRIQGKCCYMSPEQARGDEIDHRSDIFSAGVVFYEMLTGLRPFEGDSDLKSLDLVRDCEFEPPSFVEGEVPPRLDAIVERALAQEPEERYQTIDEMHLELMEFLGGGSPVTSTRVAEFLRELFPEGLEREEFQRETDEQPPDGEMDLEEALNHELERLDEPSDGSEIDPFRETQPAEGGEEASRPRIDSGPGGGRTETLTPETGSEVDEAVDTGAAGSGGPGEEPAGREQNGGLEAGRRFAVIGVALLLGIGLGAGLIFGFGGSDAGELSLRTEPSGASISVDGERLDGERTPHEFRISPGEHVVAFEKDGYASREIEVTLDPGQDETLAVHLQKEGGESDSDDERREFLIETDPSGAKLRVNQTPTGEAPQTIRVAPGETKFVEARKKGCERAQRPVFYGREQRTVTVELGCESSEVRGEADDEEAPSSETSPAEHARPAGRQVEVSFASEPSEAVVWVDDRQIGETPVSETFERGESVAVRFEKTNYETIEREIEVDEWAGRTLQVELEDKETGCLNFFAVHPQYNELAIDGEWLDERRQKLQHYELPAGEHTIRVRNPDAGRDETFEFNVEPGEDCTSLTVWDPDDG